MERDLGASRVDRAGGDPPRARRPARLAAALLALAGALLPVACTTTPEEEQARFDLYRENAQSYYDRGDYVRALHQSEQALSLQPDQESVRLIKGFALLKLGSASRDPVLIDLAIAEFESLDTGFSGTSDFRVHLGLGSAHLARALQADREIDKLETYLRSTYLSDDSRRDEEQGLADMRTTRLAHLHAAEAELRRALQEPLQRDNAYAITDLALILQSEGGRDDEAIALAEHALELLAESSSITRANLELNANLSATAKLNLQQALDNNDEKERALRDLVATVHWNRGDADGFFAQMALLEHRGLMGEVQYWNRAGVYEALGRRAEAAADLEAFLRLRARRLEYDQDEKAPETFRRIEALRGTSAGTR